MGTLCATLILYVHFMSALIPIAEAFDPEPFDPQAFNIDAFLAAEESKDLLRLTTAGSVDDGKSTLIGRLLLGHRALKGSY